MPIAPLSRSRWRPAFAAGCGEEQPGPDPGGRAHAMLESVDRIEGACNDEDARGAAAAAAS